MKYILMLLSSVLGLHAEPMVIHEWGTFTVLQNERGEAISGINADDEPVPSFVHRVGHLIQRPGQLPAGSKSNLPPCHPDVIMRLETPVMYFYPPQPGEVRLDVLVAFPGGWLTEYYPEAEAEAPNLSEGRILKDARGTLVWRDLRVGGKRSGPATEERVWTIPREVDASSVETPSGEVERYLFYRGVARLAAPVRVSRDSGRLTLTGETSRAWLAHFRDDGTCAFREFRDSVPAEFRADDYSAAAATALRAAMGQALVADGLFPKEAEAMLATWSESYFQSGGLRVFYLVPHDWTDRHLPLTVSVDARITRVMIGRIELVTPEQRRLLQELGGLPVGRELPDAYHRLGRFANALIADAVRSDPGSPLQGWARLLGVGLLAPAASP